MEIIIQHDPAHAIELAARYVASRLRDQPDLVLGLATGSTPLALYRELIRMHREEGLHFSQAHSFNLDEYLGLPSDHPCSYRHFMWENFFDHIDMPADHVHILDGMNPDVRAECDTFEANIHDLGGIDIQVLGIGANGHIGFNEPGSGLGARTRIKTLTPRTRRDNARFFNTLEEVPTHCLTMGVGTIMDSRRIVMLAFGPRKAPAVARMVEGPITAMCPASALQWHRSVKVFLDDDAAAELSMRDYYEFVYANKPYWEKLQHD